MDMNAAFSAVFPVENGVRSISIIGEELLLIVVTGPRSSSLNVEAGKCDF
jgi:hypothetical protein